MIPKQWRGAFLVSFFGSKKVRLFFSFLSLTLHGRKKSCISTLPSFSFPFAVGRRSQDGVDAWKGMENPLISLETRSKGCCRYVTSSRKRQATFPPKHIEPQVFHMIEKEPSMINTRVCTDMIDRTMLLAWSHRRGFGLDLRVARAFMLLCLSRCTDAVMIESPYPVSSYVLLPRCHMSIAWLACWSVGLYFSRDSFSPRLTFCIRTIHLFSLSYRFPCYI